MLHETDPRLETEDKGINEKIMRILFVLDKASGPAPLGYISLHTGVKEPLEIIEEMSALGFVYRCLPSIWSGCRDPMYELAPKGRERLYRGLY
jgi:hypothetical protein